MALRKAKRDNTMPARARPRTRAAVVRKRRTRRALPATGTFLVVGIGASAGGLDAFKQLFSTMPGDCGIAFVLIQHLDPTRKSLTAELVGTYTTMQVVQAIDGMVVEPNHVYVIPPNKYLTISKRILKLSPPTAPRSLRMAVDHFLRSLAEDQRERAIGVVLSGTGTDGTLGLREIKVGGGMTIVQDPQTAQYDGMPRSAIASGCVDHVAPAEHIADALLAYARQLPVPEAVAEDIDAQASDSLASTMALLRTATKFDFSVYKKGTLWRRIQRRMSLRHSTGISEYVSLLGRDAAEVTALFQDLLLKVTGFFRDPAAWGCLQKDVIRSLVAAKHDDGPLRVWIPACATGEEAYSLAMVLIEELNAAGSSCRLQVFASDVDATALESARQGVYPETIAADVSPERLSRFFTKSERTYRVSKELRDTVTFAQQNLVSDPPFSKLDLISCRNLLIYLENAAQERLLALLHFALGQGGYLFLGMSEGVGQQEDLFEAISKKWRIYRRIGPARHASMHFPVVPAPVLPMASDWSPTQQYASRLPVLAQQVLLERYAPACVIVNSGCNIVYFHGRTDEYLAQPTGPPTKDLIAQARSGLRAKLREAVHESLRSGNRVVSPGVHVRRGSAYPRVTITVEPLGAGAKVEGLWLVSFEDEPGAAPSVSGAPASGPENPPADPGIVSELEYELTTTKKDLQHTIESFESANEELMSVNEELQSSNEELETSKEELQSLNEELSTSNTQLEGKIGELQATNNDLDNLLTSTSIATLFLDKSFCIRRFTPTATQLFSLIPSDIGRPIADIAFRFTDPDLLADAAAVLDRPIAPKKEVQSNDGRWYVRQVLPYRTHDGRTEGVVITLSDVAAEALQEARLYAEAIVDTVREPLLVLDADLQVISANRAFYSAFRVAERETVGRPLYELGNHEWDIPQLRSLLKEVLPRKRVLTDFEVLHEFRSLGPRVMLLNARTIVRGGDRPDLILLAIEDMTERRQMQDVLRETEAREQAEEQVRHRQARLAHALRISTVGELASGLAHELNQPLSAIANDVEACAIFVRSGNMDSEKLLTLLNEASTEALRASEIVEHLRQFIRKGEPQFEQTDMGEILRHLPRVVAHELAREQIALRLDLRSQSLPIYADRIQIEQVVVNLIQNAVDSVRGASGDDRDIELSVRAVKGKVEVAVRDKGAGVSAETARRLFEPFFTTKPHGLGLGLAISRSIIEAHQGRIWADCPTDGGRGITVRFSLPLHGSTPSRKEGSK